MTTEDNDNKPNYEGDRTVLLPGNLPALKPIPVKPRPEPSPKSPDVDSMGSMHKGMANFSRRTKLTDALGHLLAHNADLLDDAEAFLVVLQAKASSGA